MNSLQKAKSANQAWIDILVQLTSFGYEHSPKNRATREILNYGSVVDMSYPVITIPGRKLGYKFLFAEAAWILSGDNRVETIAPFSKAIAAFSDDGYRFQGAYGPKVSEQLRYVIDTLLDDRASRQAVISIWRESPRKSKDIPCTLTLQFLIRDDHIHCIANMRSSDIWLGWVYDVFNFTMITTYIALMYNQMKTRVFQPEHIKLGKLYINAGSQHLYASNYEQADNCLQDVNAWSYSPLVVSSFDNPRHLMSHIVALRDTRETIKSGFMKEINENLP